MNLQWHISIAASWAHAAAAVSAERPLKDPALAEAIRPPVADVRMMLTSMQIDCALFFDHLVPLAHDDENLRELAEVALRKTKGSAAADALGNRIGTELTDCRDRFLQQQPNLANELPTRMPVLREQWESRGPGLLYELADLTERGLLSDQAKVYLVYPACGGGGGAHPWYNAVHLEAVLANPQPKLPEMVRLAWSLAQLKFDIPQYGDDLGVPMFVSRLAMIPLVLSAAKHVDWARADEPTIRLAVQTWLPVAARHANTLLDWWQVYQERRPGWATGVTTLAMMMA